MSDLNVEGVSVGQEPVAAAIAEGAWAQKIEFADPPPGATYFAWPSRICCSAVVSLRWQSWRSSRNRSKRASSCSRRFKVPFKGNSWLLASVRRKMHLSLIFLEFLSEMDLEVLGLPSKISAERAVLRVLSEESSRECPMRIAFDPQRRFDCPPVLEVRLNTSCRDEI